MARHEDDEDYDDEDELEPVRFLGSLNGVAPNLSANARLVDAGLLRAKDLVTDAMSRRADALRLEPKGEIVTVGISIDGIPYPLGRLGKGEGLAVTQVLKLLAGLDIKQRKATQSGGIKAQFEEKNFELQVGITPVPDGERLLLRINDLANKLTSPSDVGMSEEQKKLLRELCSNKGIFIACGPSGSGLTTLEWAVIQGLDSFIYSIYTLGETGRNITNISPFEVNSADDLSTTIVRAVRKEADVLILETFKNPEYVKQAFSQAGEISMISDMTARDIPSAIQQLIAWVGDPAIVAQGLNGLVTTKLIRKLCADCKQAYRPNPAFIAKAGLPDSVTALYRPPQPPSDPEEEEDYYPCEKCGEMGYFGRTGMFEFLRPTDAVRKVIAELGKGDPAAFSTALRKVMREEKQPTLQQDGLRLVASGTTSLEELQRVFRPPAGAAPSGAVKKVSSSGASPTQSGARPVAKPGTSQQRPAQPQQRPGQPPQRPGQPPQQRPGQPGASGQPKRPPGPGGQSPPKKPPQRPQ